MEATIKDILDERINCCKVVQETVERHCNASMTEMKIRNIIQIELLDELQPTDKNGFYEKFAVEYIKCNTIRELKLALI